MLKYIFQFAVACVFLYGPFIWCRYRGESYDAYGLSWRFEKKNLIECLALTAVLLGTLSVIAILWPYEKLPRYSPFDRTASLALAGIGAAIIEETFYRGLIQTLFRKKFGAVVSIVITSAIFAASHGFVAPMQHVLAVFPMGCVMGFLRERHGNISTSTLFHMLGNLWAIWFAPGIWFPMG